MNKNNLYECDIVQDLLPLYYDDACTLSSREFVQRHLATCEKCKKTYAELENNTIDTFIKKESAGVLERHARKERSAAYKAGVVIAFLLLIPIIITFIVSVNSGGGLGVFSVVAASMMLVAAVTVVPLVSPRKRFVKSILSGILALEFIFFFIDKMNGGGRWVLWSIPTIFGLSVILFPFVIRNLTLPPVLSDKKALLTMAWDTLWLFLTIFEICNHSGDIEGMRDGFIIALTLMAGVWLAFLVARYLTVNVWIKAGIIVSIGSIWITFANDVCAYFIEHRKQLTILGANFSNWSDPACANANSLAVTLILGGIVSIVLITIGMVSGKRKQDDQI